jgi:hypothetical protein
VIQGNSSSHPFQIDAMTKLTEALKAVASPRATDRWGGGALQIGGRLNL